MWNEPIKLGIITHSFSGGGGGFGCRSLRIPAMSLLGGNSQADKMRPAPPCILDREANTIRISNIVLAI